MDENPLSLNLGQIKESGMNTGTHESRSIIIGVFCYNRASKLKSCIDALLKNPECPEMEVVFFSDGAKGEKDEKGVAEVRAYIESLTGFKRVLRHFRDRNFSTGPNFQAGLKFLSANYDEFIVVEDDLIVSPNYIRFLKDGLDFYRTKKSVFCITAYVYPINTRGYQFDSIIYKRFCSYGWAGWADRFPQVVWDEAALQQKIDSDRSFLKRLNAEGYDLSRMLKKQISGKISTWDVQLQVHIAEHRLKVVYPVLSKVNNIGFDEESTNTVGINFLVTPVDKGQRRNFKFCEEGLIVPELQKQIKKPFGLRALVTRKLINEFIKATNQVKKAG